ncbi:MAG: CaiB/BaiF CoA-transferase family protein [Pseudomonadota bacterium]
MPDHPPTPPPGPLAGLRVLEIGHFVAAPFCTRLLADFGADVIKIEPPGKGDPVRGWGAMVDGKSVWWSQHARNKRLITLNLKAPEGLAIARDLVAQSDVVVENMRPGLIETFGLGPDEIGRVKPGCVLVRISGFGQDGPYKMRPAFGAIGEALGGLRYLTGYPKGAVDLPPVRTGLSLSDSISGLYGAFGALAALFHAAQQDAPAEGVRVIDVSLTESILSMLDASVPDYSQTGEPKQPSGSAISTAAPSSAYRCSDGSHILIAANSDPLFARLAALMGQPALAQDARFVTNRARLDNSAALDALIEAWSRAHTPNAALALLEAAAIPSCKIYDTADIAADPHYRARGAITPVADPDFPREVLHVAPVPVMQGLPSGAIRWPGAAVGAHTDEILAELGTEPEQIAALRAAGVI